jgi:hypothetical protein
MTYSNGNPVGEEASNREAHLPHRYLNHALRERIFMERITSDRSIKASREGSKWNYGTSKT